MSCRALVLSGILCALAAGAGHAGDETLYMAILNSRVHRWGSIQNPVVGIFVSNDRGETWVHRGWREYIRTFYVEEGSDGTIWSACGNGVLRSTDEGKTWKVTTGWQVTEVLKVSVDPLDPSTVFAATAYGIFATTDGGQVWERRSQGFQTRFTGDVRVDWSDSRRVLAATEEGVYLSTDGGLRWVRTGPHGLGIRCITQHPTNERIFWVGTEDDGTFRSADGGRSWERMAGGLNHQTVYTVAFDPAKPTTIYAGTHGGGVYRSTDGGKRWVMTGSGLTNRDVHSIVVLPSKPSTLFAGTLNGGLFVSRDGGGSWEFNSQDQAQVWGLSAR
ncbi:MAG: hypothetical protein WBG01_10405 [Bacteroidota bacterium]